MNQATNWCDYSGASYLFNYCVPSSTLTSGGIPYSWDKMFQYPHTGNGFGGVCFYGLNGVLSERGYIQTVLTQTLQASKKYVVKFYVNVNNDSQYAVDKICALLTNTPIVCNTGTFSTKLGNPQIINKNGIITDTLNWIEICDTMTAIGNESYLIIGNFFSDTNTNILQFNSSAREINAEYNIDDVSVEEVKDAICKSDTNICKGDSILIGINETENATYNWLPTNGLSCSTCANPKASPSSNTTYTLTKQQCSYTSTAKINITVKDCNPKAIEIPNVFTPNGDGVNDTFNFSIVGASDVNFAIYNRWGNLIQTTTLQQQTTILWDGHTTSGEACSEGVYFYTLSYKANGDVITSKGFITLMR